MQNNSIIKSQNLVVESSSLPLLHDFVSTIRIFLEIIKFKITILVSFTTGLGYILASSSISFNIMYPIAGIFLLACSASALNHYQERNTDRLMNRTLRRPIPSGRISPASVLLISVIIFLLASVLLISKTNIITLCVGYLTFFWYNGIYTPLKKLTPWAIIPGSLVGALPPVAGWTAAGGSLNDPKIMIISLYFFIWQIPHFWLLLMLYAEDYRRGGFPILTDVLNMSQLKRITFIWLVAAVMIALLVPLFGVINFKFSFIMLAFISVWMIFVSFKFLFSDNQRKSILNSFININFYTLLFITILSLDKFVKML